CLFGDCQRTLVKRPCLREVPLGLKQASEVVEVRGRIGMLGTEHLLPDRQRALVERPSARKVALVLKQVSEIVEAQRRIGMLWTSSGPIGSSMTAARRTTPSMRRSALGQRCG